MSVRGNCRFARSWNGGAHASRRVSDFALGAKSALSVAGTLAWSCSRWSTVPASISGETMTAGTRGPSIVKSKRCTCRCQIPCRIRPIAPRPPPGAGAAGGGRVECVVGLVGHQVVLGVLAIANTGAAPERGVVVQHVQRRPVIGLDKRVIWQLARGHVLGEACAGIPVLVPLRSVPQRWKRPGLWRVVVIDPPRGAVLFKQLEDGGIGIRPDFDIRFTVGGRGVQEIAVGPRLPRHRAEPAVTYREIQGKLTQDGNLRRRLAEHDQRAAALGGGRCRPLTPLPPAKHGTEHATELDGDEATGLALVADRSSVAGSYHSRSARVA